MNRSFSIKYKPASNIQLMQRPEKRVLNTYDHQTDNDIFALGDAAEDEGVNVSQFDIPDDLFKDFEFSLGEAFQRQFSRTPEHPDSVTYETDDHAEGATDTRTHENNVGFETLAEEPHDHQTTGDVQVSTITKTLPDGRRVQTRIIRGPIKTRRRIIKINRELPSGETELLGTYEAPIAEEDVNKTVRYAADKLVPGLVQQEDEEHKETAEKEEEKEEEEEEERHAPCVSMEDLSDDQQQDTRRMSTEADYDNTPLLPMPTPPKPRAFPSVTPSFTKTSSQVLIPQDQQLHSASQDNQHVDSNTCQPFQQTNSFHHPHLPLLHAASLPAPVEHDEIPYVTPPLPQPEPSIQHLDPAMSYQDTPRSKRSTSLPGSSFHRRMSMDEDVIELFEPSPDTIIHEVTLEDSDDSTCCPKWCPRVWKRKKRQRLTRGSDETAKGKLGMTQSEINPDDKALPGLTGLVANYARMLYEERAGFIETLFRAVKLNKLDVVRILCKIVYKSGLKVASRELREPESSATIMHVALLYNHTDIVDFLIATRETNLIMAKYESEEYRNQTGLHVAVANGNPEMVEKLLVALDTTQKQILINTIADGKYFRSQHVHGQLCLTAAAWAGNCEIIKMLVQYGGNLALKNHNGNTLLHSIVLQSAQYPMRNNYEWLLEAVWEAASIWAEQMVFGARNVQQRELEQVQMQINLFKELLAIRNNDGYTPLALATVSNSRLLTYMLNLERIYKIPQNKLGSITWVTYDVTDITSFAYNTYNKFSVMHILAHNSQRLSRRAHLANLENNEPAEDYLDMEPIKALHTCKWSVYRLMYIGWLAVHLFYMVVFTAATAGTNSNPFYNLTNMTTHHLNRSESHYVFALFTILPILYIILEILDLYGNTPYRISFMTGQPFLIRLCKGIQSEWTITGNGPYRVVNIGFAFFTIEWFFLYLTKDRNQDISLAMSLLLGWVFVLFFTRGCRVTSRFSIMIQKMFFKDLIYFLTVYGIILIGFSFAMNALFTYKLDAELTINKVFYDMMNVVTDLDKKQTIEDARHPLFAKLLLIFYAIVAVILLMNMLIAMMNTSYETVRMTQCNLWKQQQLSIMLLLERRLFWWKWLCQQSEKDIWRKESGNDIRCYLDVTVLHTSNYRSGL